MDPAPFPALDACPACSPHFFARPTLAAVVSPPVHQYMSNPTTRQRVRLPRLVVRVVSLRHAYLAFSPSVLRHYQLDDGMVWDGFVRNVR